MALVKAGVAGQFSGKIAGNVFARNRGGLYVRAWAKPTGGPSAAQTVARNALSSTATAWKSLTDDQRTAWQAYAAATPKLNRLGDSILLSGINWFTSINSFMDLVGLARVLVPPNLSASPFIPVTPPSITVLDVSTNAATIADPVDLDVGYALALFLSAGSPVSVSAPSLMKPLFVGSIPGADPFISPVSFPLGTFHIVAGQQYRWELRRADPDGAIRTLNSGVIVAQA